jgi:hypothetical protein
MKKITDDILWDFADQLLSATQHKEVAELIKNDPALQKKWNAILQQKVVMSSSDLVLPNTDFSSNLLEIWQVEQQTKVIEIQQPTANMFLLKVLFISFTLLSLVLLYIAISQNSTTEPLPIQIPNIEFVWSKILFILVGVVAMINVRLIEKIILYRYYGL